MGFFGVSKREAWQQFCSETHAKYIDLGFWSGHRVEFAFQNWLIVLDTYTVSNGKTSTTYTRIRAPFINKSEFNFRIYKKGLFSELVKMLGGQDIEVGDSELDDNFIIRGNEEEYIKKLFSNELIKQLIIAQPRIDLQIKDDEGFFGKHFPDGADELYFSVVGVIKDIDLLKKLFDLFGEVLMTLTEMGVISDEAPEITL